MADYSKSKKANFSTYPVRAIDAASQQRVESILTPEKLRRRFFHGIPLKSPLTGEEYTKEDLKDYITRAINQVELDAMIDVRPVQRLHRIAFARDIYEEYVYLEIPNKPILSVDKLGIVTSDNTTIYDFPAEWIDTANFIDGRVNVIPFSAGGFSKNNLLEKATTVGGGFLVLLGIRGDVPAYWECHCTTGFNFKGGVPFWVNELIGLQAAIMIFNNLIPQFQYSSYSLGLDGVSQSQTTQAPQLYQEVRDQYVAKYEDITSKIKTRYNNNIIVGMI